MSDGFSFRIGPAPARPGPFRTLGIASSGLSAQRQRLEVISENIANVETTRTPEGGPYRRKVVGLAPRPTSTADDPRRPTLSGFQDLLAREEDAGGVEVTGVQRDPSAGELVYDPGHPDADASGYVQMPNVNLTEEMADMMLARRSYEANATVFQVAKSVLRRAIQI
jgi:flagellar basal-body rod protein FlgC